MKDESENFEFSLGKLEITDVENIPIKYELLVDIKNKLLYFIQENIKEPTLCVSIDSLCLNDIKNIKLRLS